MPPQSISGGLADNFKYVFRRVVFEVLERPRDPMLCLCGTVDMVGVSGNVPSFLVLRLDVPLIPEMMARAIMGRNFYDFYSCVFTPHRHRLRNLSSCGTRLLATHVNYSE